MKRAGLLLLMLLAIATDTFSDDSIGVIIYAEGTEMSIYREGNFERFRLNYDSVIGLPVYAGDMLQTGEGTFVEVQLAPAQNVLKVAENTTFTLTSLAGGGNGTFEVTYGRVRAQVRTLARNERFEIMGRTATAGVRGTDFGYDVVAERGGAVEANIYCFEGEVEVSVTDDESPSSPDAGAAGRSVRIRANEMVTVRTDTETVDAPVPEAKTVTEAIREYWSTNDFKTDTLPADRLLDEFPELRTRVFDDTGVDIQDILSRETAQQTAPVPQQEVSEQAPAPSITRRVAEAPNDDREEELSPEEVARRVEQRRQFNRTAGWLVTTAGALLTGGSFALQYFGDEYLPEMGVDTRESLRQGALVSGSILLATGIASFVMSFF